MYTITLSDGTILDNLELNGNNYISETLIDDAVFEDNLATVEIHDGESAQVYENMKLIANRVFGGKSWFILAEKTKQEIERERMIQDIKEIKRGTGTGQKGETGFASRIDDLEERIEKLEG